MQKIFGALLSILVMSFFCSFLGQLFGDSRTPSTIMAHKISNSIGQKLKRKYDLDFAGIYEEGPDGKYKCIGFELKCNRILSKEQGRILLLNCSQDILADFNSYPNFQKYMANVPFRYDNIMIRIYIEPPKNPDVYYPNIGVFCMYKDSLWYKTYTPNGEYNYFSKEKESIEEAKKIVEAQMNPHLH